MRPLRLMLLFAVAAALVPTAPAGAFDLRLTGADDEHHQAGEERDRILATGGGARLHMTDRIGCHLAGAHCEELHGHRIATGHCEDTYGQARLRHRGRTTRYFIAGSRCPHGTADVEHGVLISRQGLVDYVMRTRWKGAAGHRERVTIRLPSRTASLRSAVQCSVCRFLVQLVRGSLAPHPSEQAIHDAVVHACHLFPVSYQGLCSVVVEQHGAALIEQLTGVLEASDLCRRVDACSSRRRATGRSGCGGP